MSKKRTNHDLIRVFIKNTKLLFKNNQPDCTVWTGAQFPNGYGVIRIKNVNYRVHRVFYEYFTGNKIPNGMTVDHLCNTKLCCKISHMRIVSPIDNRKRGYYPNKHKTHCPRGHEYTELNTHVNSFGRRVCKTCDLQRTRLRRYLNGKT